MFCMRAFLVCFQSASYLPDFPAGLYISLEGDSNLCLESPMVTLADNSPNLLIGKI